MAMAPILLDSNSYFRLARSIRPLLGVVFGSESYCLFVIPDLESEFSKSPRLRRKFHWVNEAEYLENRKHVIPLNAHQSKEATLVYDFISNHARAEGSGASPVDIRALAIAYVLRIKVATDDSAMFRLAVDFNIDTLKTLDLLGIMWNTGHISMGDVRQIVAYWQYENDKPAGFESDYHRLFGEPIPPS